MSARPIVRVSPRPIPTGARPILRLPVRPILRVAVGIALGIGLAGLPFLHYAPRAHRHASDTTHTHAHHD